MQAPYSFTTFEIFYFKLFLWVCDYKNISVSPREDKQINPLEQPVIELRSSSA